MGFNLSFSRVHWSCLSNMYLNEVDFKMWMRVVQKYNLCSQFHVLRLNACENKKSSNHCYVNAKTAHKIISTEKKKCREFSAKKWIFIRKKKLTVFSCLFMSLCSVLKALLHHCHQLRNATVAVKSSSKH